MDEDDRERAFLTALTTEHFVLQSTRSTISSEAIGRAALYLGALSSALIALGFVVSRRAVFGPFLAAVLPVVVVLGLFTFLRVFQIGLESTPWMAAHERRVTPIADRPGGSNLYYAPGAGDADA
jgi:hypothetical protein